MMKTSDFDFSLPPELIAQEPVEPRDASRLLVLGPEEAAPADRLFHDLPDFLVPGDELVVNESRVLPARLYGRKPTGGRVEVLLLRPKATGEWLALAKGLGRADVVFFADGEWRATVQGREEDAYVLAIEGPNGSEGLLAAVGRMPLPPYIHGGLRDPERYQTVYARPAGSVAAPTAGLHFTPELLARLSRLGVSIRPLVLHVGAGTFQPVRTDDLENHRMHSEYYRIEAETAEALNRAREQGRRIVVVGTTAVRVLESVADSEGWLRPAEGETRIFIHPGYRFRLVQNLITNFHLPRSTLLMLVAALAGRERILAAYAEAVRLGYRFYSFGDAMLILGEGGGVDRGKGQVGG